MVYRGGSKASCGDRAFFGYLVGLLSFTHLADTRGRIARALGVKFDQGQQHGQALVEVVHPVPHDL